MVAVCGLVCDDCRAFIATQNCDSRLKAEVARDWSTKEEPFTPEDIDCDGCLAGKRLHKFCFVCETRKCAAQKQVETCAQCEKYPCQKLEKLWNSWKNGLGKKARSNLEEIRKKSHPKETC